MHQVIHLLSKVAQRHAPSRMLSFDLVHVFKTMQMMSDNKKISRSRMMQELELGEGSIKTLVKHLKMHGLVENSNAGMWLTNKGETLYAKLHVSIPREMDIAKCSVALGKFNHAVLLKNMAYTIKSGIEQRDAAIKAGAVGATTLLCKNERLVLPGTGEDLMRNDQKIHSLIMEKLSPEQNDVIIIGSSQSKKIAEMAAKSAALYTIEDHEKH
jgi:predicted transcriptional regulator